MSQQLVISSNPIETTVAIVEDDRLVEFCIERHAQKALIGSIYKGRVTRVLPGMQSAFVNLGLRRDAFLYVTDVLDSSGDIEADPDAPLVEADAVQPDQDEDGSESNDSLDPDSGDESVPASASAGDEEPSSRRRSRRRRRSRKRPGEAGDDGHSGPSAEAVPGESEPGFPEPLEDGDGPMVLPGESIAKYRDAGRQVGASPEAATEEAAAPGSGEDPPSDDDSRARAEAQAGEASGPAAGGGTGPDSPDGNAPDGDEPPRLAASVKAPPAIAELRLGAIDWLKRKLGGPARDTSDRPRDSKPARRRGSRRRSSKPRQQSQAQPGSPQRDREAPAKARPSRRSAGTNRQRGPRAKGPPRGDAARRSGRPERAQQTSPEANIGELLEPGQELVVQVNKEPVAAKGSRVTSHVSLPGRYMVYMTTAKHNGVARTIQPEAERNRLRKIVDKHSAGKEGGFVVRTAGGGVSEEVLVADMEFLHKQWSDLKAKAEKRKAPATLHSDLDMVERVLRDNLGQSYESIWVDSEAEYERILAFVKREQPALADRVKLYNGPKPIHEAKFGIKQDLERALKPKVWLKSGGYIVIDQTEALVAIDVNTGRYVGKSNRLEDTVLKTNLEAAEEIIRQLRLRDLGGIIVIDFIDMEDRKNRQSVHQVLHEALKSSKSPTRLLPFNDFGLVVITRKTARQSLERALCMPCPVCSGAGTVKSAATVMSEVFSAAGRIAAKKSGSSNGHGKSLTLRVHPEMEKSIKKGSRAALGELKEIVGSGVVLRGDSSMPIERFKLG